VLEKILMKLAGHVTNAGGDLGHLFMFRKLGKRGKP